MNDYVTLKTIDMRRADAARRQRNADHLAALSATSPSLRERFQHWWARLISPSTVSLAERTQRLQAPPHVTATNCSETSA